MSTSTVALVPPANNITITGVWTVPSDWSTDNTIQLYGAGGSGDSGYAGGGGGGFVELKNLNLTPGSTITYQIGGVQSGSDGGNTHFGSTDLNTFPTYGVAYGGKRGSNQGRGGTTAGSTVAGVTATKRYNGGNGATSFLNGAAGGGAGPYGNGESNPNASRGGNGGAGFGGTGGTFNTPFGLNGTEGCVTGYGSGGGGYYKNTSPGSGGALGGGGGAAASSGAVGGIGGILIIYTQKSYYNNAVWI